MSLGVRRNARHLSTTQMRHTVAFENVMLFDWLEGFLSKPSSQLQRAAVNHTSCTFSFFAFLRDPLGSLPPRSMTGNAKGKSKDSSRREKNKYQPNMQKTKIHAPPACQFG